MPAARILIVEDEGLTAMELQRKLKFLGYDVPTFAFSGKEAIIKAEELKPDLILMDIVLKGKIDGIDAAKEITKNQDVPVIYLTAHGDETTKKRAKNTGPYAYILKPFDESELQKNIDQALYQHQMDKKLEKSQIMDETIEKSGGAVIVTDKDGIIHFMNYSASYLTKWDREEALEKNINEVFKLKSHDLDDMESGNPVLELLNNDLNEIKRNDWLKTSPNSIIPIKYTVAPIKNENDELTGATLIFKDMSHVDEVDHNKEFIEKICNQSSIATAAFEVDGSLLYANESFLNFYSAESVNKLENMDLFNDFGLNNELKLKLEDSGILDHEIKVDMNKSYFKSNKIFKNQIYLDLKINRINAEDKDENKANNSDFEGYLLHIKDVTDVKQSEKSLNEIKSNYELIFNSIDDIFFAMDSDFNCIHWNSAAETLTGINSQEAIGKSLYGLFPELKDSEVEQLYLEAFKSQKHQSLIKDIKSDGNGFFEINAYPSKKGVSVIIRDISLSKKSEEDLKKREKLFKSVLETQTNPLCVFYEDGSIYFANDSFKSSMNEVNSSPEVHSNFLEIIPSEEKKELKHFIESFPSFDMEQDFSFKTSRDDKVLNWDVKASIKDEYEKQLFLAIAYELSFEKKEIDDLKSQNHALKSENKGLNKLKGKLQRDIEGLQVEIDNVYLKEEKLLSENKKIRELSDEEVKTLKTENGDLKLQIAQLKTSKLNLNEKITSLTIEFEEKIKKLEKNKDLADSEINEVTESEKNLQESLKKTERQYKDLLEETKVLRNDKSNLKQQTRKVQKEYGEMEKEFSETLDSYKAQVSQLKQINKSLNKEYEFLEKRSIKSREEVETQVKILENEKNLVEKSQNKLLVQLDDSKAELKSFKNENKALKLKISEYKSSEISLNEKYDNMVGFYENKLSEFDESNQTLVKELDGLKNTEKSLKQKESLLKDEMGVLKKRQSDLNSQVSTLKQEKLEMDLKYKELQKSSNDSLNKIRLNKEELENNLNTLKDSNEALIAENKDLVKNFQQKISNLEKEKSKILSEMEILKKARDDLKKLLEGRNYALQDMQTQFKRNTQTMNSILGINSTYLMEKYMEKTKTTQMQIELASLAHSNLFEFSELGKVDLQSYLNALIVDIDRYYTLDPDKIKFNLEANKLSLKSEISSNIGLLIAELISFILNNVEKSQQGKINVLINYQDKKINLELNTNLQIMDKGIEHDLTLQIANTLALQLGGDLNVNFGINSVFKLEFAADY